MAHMKNKTIRYEIFFAVIRKRDTVLKIIIKKYIKLKSLPKYMSICKMSDQKINVVIIHFSSFLQIKI